MPLAKAVRIPLRTPNSPWCRLPLAWPPPGGGGGNAAPEAEAGVAQTAALGDTVVLYAGGSIDADGNLLSPSWQFVSVPAGSLTALSDPVAVRPSFVIDVAGDYVVELVVNDGTVNSAPDTVTISTVNSAPVAQAGRDRAISVGNTVHLDGSASSDFDGDRLGYSWTLTSKPAASTGHPLRPEHPLPDLRGRLGGHLRGPAHGQGRDRVEPA